MHILKFGASTLGSARRFREAAALTGRAGKCVAVLSAPSGMPDLLREIVACLRGRDLEGARGAIDRLDLAGTGLAEELFPAGAARDKACGYLQDLRSFLVSITKEPFRDASERLVLSQGERLSTFFMEICLAEQGVRAQVIPAVSFLRTDSHAQPDGEYLRTALPALLDPAADLYLTQGNLCLNVRGEADLLGQGGADFSACLVGAALQAEEIQIWTSRADHPKRDTHIVVGNAPVGHLHYEEAAELAYFGAEMLHPSSVQPARNAGIPIRLLDLSDPGAPGTRIDDVLERDVLKAVAAKSPIAAIQIKSSRMLLAHGFLRRVFEIFEGYRTAIDMICTSEVGVSLTIDDTRYLDEIVRDLRRFGTVNVDTDMCIVCVVGDLDWGRSGTVSRVMKALAGIPVRMVSYGGTRYNLSLLIRKEDQAEALRLLGETLVRP